MTLKAQAFRGLRWSAVQRWSVQGIQVLVLLVMMRLLEVTDYGLVAYATVIRAFAELFVDQGMGEAIVQRDDLQREHIDSVFWFQGGLALVMASVMFFGAPGFAWVFDQPAIAPLLQWMALGPVLSACSSVQAALLRRDLRFKKIAALDVTANMVGGVMGVTLAFMGAGVWALVWQMLSARITSVLILWTATQWRPSFRFSPPHCLQMLSYSIHVFIVNILNVVNTRIDQLIIGLWLGQTALGYYAVGTALMRQILLMFNGVVHQVALPVFSRVQKDLQRMGRGLYEAVEITALVIFPVAVGMMSLGGLFVGVIFGEKWLPSAPVFQWFAMAGMVQSITSLMSPIMLAAGYPAARMKLFVCNTTLNLLVFFITAPYGIVAVAAGYAIRATLFSPVIFYVVRRLIGISWRQLGRRLAAPLSAAATLAAVVLLLRTQATMLPRPWLLIVCIAAAAAAYLAMIWWLDRAILMRVVSMVRLVRQTQTGATS